MREPSTRRDQREIVVHAEMRADRPPRQAARRSARTARAATPDDLRASVLALVRWVGSACRTRPGEALGCLVSLTAVAYVSMNALGFQAGRHPAPILPLPTLAEGRGPPRAEPAPTPGTRTGEVRTAVPRDAGTPREAATPRDAVKPASGDAIGEMIRSADDTTASVAPKAAVRSEPKAELRPDGPIMQAQRALARLGYGALKPDGVMGPTTKAAIERFERDRKLPVTGEAAGRTLRELAARAAPPKG